VFRDWSLCDTLAISGKKFQNNNYGNTSDDLYMLCLTLSTFFLHYDPLKSMSNNHTMTTQFLICGIPWYLSWPFANTTKCFLFISCILLLLFYKYICYMYVWIFLVKSCVSCFSRQFCAWLVFCSWYSCNVYFRTCCFTVLFFCILVLWMHLFLFCLKVMVG
jgi:hypothetical protein